MAVAGHGCEMSEANASGEAERELRSTPAAVVRAPLVTPPVATAPVVTARAPATAEVRAELHRRVHALVRGHLDFVWRSLRRLGVAEADCDDGCQRVWVVVARKAEAIEPGKAKSFIFSVVVRVAAEMRRSQRRHRHVSLNETSLAGGAPDAQHLLERQRELQILDEVLDGLSWDQRTVFVMFEFEGMTSLEIGEVLGLSRGTVASRLRLAREAFQRGVQRHQARHRGTAAGTGALGRSESSRTRGLP
jgi:RNA polymerase sigma-70 factor, ECF subfamily